MKENNSEKSGIIDRAKNAINWMDDNSFFENVGNLMRAGASTISPIEYYYYAKELSGVKVKNDHFSASVRVNNIDWEKEIMNITFCIRHADKIKGNVKIDLAKGEKQLDLSMINTYQDSILLYPPKDEEDVLPCNLILSLRNKFFSVSLNEMRTQIRYNGIH